MWFSLLPILALGLSAHGGVRRLTLATRLPFHAADNYVTKPYEPDFLLGRIQSLLASPVDESGAGGGETATLEVTLAGQRFRVKAGRQQVLNLLVSTFEAQAQEDVWGKNHNALTAASFDPQGRARRVEGGFLFNGKHGFSSGVDYANWVICGGYIVDGEKRDGPHFFLVPRADITIIDDWRTMGLAGTGSKSFVIDKAFIPAHRFLDGKQSREGRGPGVKVNTAAVYRTPRGGGITDRDDNMVRFATLALRYLRDVLLDRLLRVVERLPELGALVGGHEEAYDVEPVVEGEQRLLLAEEGAHGGQVRRDRRRRVQPLRTRLRCALVGDALLRHSRRPLLVLVPLTAPALLRDLRARLDGVGGIEVVVCPPAAWLGDAADVLAELRDRSDQVRLTGRVDLEDPEAARPDRHDVERPVAVQRPGEQPEDEREPHRHERIEAPRRQGVHPLLEPVVDHARNPR